MIVTNKRSELVELTAEQYKRLYDLQGVSLEAFAEAVKEFRPPDYKEYNCISFALVIKIDVSYKHYLVFILSNKDYGDNNGNDKNKI